MKEEPEVGAPGQEPDACSPSPTLMSHSVAPACRRKGKLDGGHGTDADATVGAEDS